MYLFINVYCWYSRNTAYAFFSALSVSTRMNETVFSRSLRKLISAPLDPLRSAGAERQSAAESWRETMSHGERFVSEADRNSSIMGEVPANSNSYGCIVLRTYAQSSLKK